MSSTRRSDPSAPMSYEKFMSAPEFVALRPIPGNLVLAKALLYTDAKIRELAFFLQAMSMQPGGLAAVARKIVEWYPERCQESSSEKARMLEFAATLCPDKKLSIMARTVDLLSDFLPELILNPNCSLSKISCHCFSDLAGALATFKKAHEQAAMHGFVMTSAGEAIMETLDQGLTMARMVVIEGDAGAGKSTNAEVWCAARPGLVRYVSLTGITNRTTFFQKIGQAIGLATCQQKAQVLQGKIEDFFARSGMMLVIDEAHYLWPQSVRGNSAPELIDWVDTALVNLGVPVALVCTDQFSKLKNRVERSTGWTSQQFVHRVFRFRRLDTKPTRDDVEAVTRKLLSAVWNADSKRWEGSAHECNSVAVDALVSYAVERSIPFACVASCIDEARFLTLKSGRVMVSNRDLSVAINKGQIPSDSALRRAFNPVPAERRATAKAAAACAPRGGTKAYVSIRPEEESLPLENGWKTALTTPRPEISLELETKN